MKAGIAIEAWKLPIFSKHLTEAGFGFDNAGEFVPPGGMASGVLMLHVITDESDRLRRTVEAAQAECKRTGPPQGDELNPQHPVTAGLHDHWHKLCAIVMAKLGTEHVVITQADTEAIQHRAIVAQVDGEEIHLRLVSMDVAQTLAAKHDGAKWK